MPDPSRFDLLDLHVAAHVPLAVVTRGDEGESVHYGSVAVVDRDGALTHAAGDPHAHVFTRSALKPLQALPFVRDGGPERYGYSGAQLALLCASHSGEACHVNAIADMLARAGNAPDDLACGTHAPLHFEARGEIAPRPPWSPLAHNCSGKHAGMLAACSLHGWPKRGYLAVDHPLQREIRAAVAQFAGVDDNALRTGTDGCSAPNYAMPLDALARAYARLAIAANDDSAFGPAPRRLRDAMLAHPEMVSGQGRSDLALMRAGRGDWVTKIGAEGVQAIGVVSRGLGVAIKIADGSRRGLIPVAIAVLEGLGLVDQQQRDELQHLAHPALVNLAGMPTGSVCPLVRLLSC